MRAPYVVAADGAHSPIRERLGIPMRGHGSFSNSITIYFRADVKPLLRERNLSVIYVFGPRLQGFFRFSKAGDAGFLVVNKAIDEHGELSADIWGDTGEAKCVEFVREALGDAEIDVEVENVQRWNASAEWAESFQQGQDLPGRRLGPRHAADRRLRRQRGRPGRAQPGLEARLRRQGRGRARSTCVLRRRAPTDRRGDRRAGVRALRAPARARARQGEPARDGRRRGDRPRLPVPVERGHLRRRRGGRSVRRPARADRRARGASAHVALESGSTLDLFGRSFVLLTADEGWQARPAGWTSRRT